MSTDESVSRHLQDAFRFSFPEDRLRRHQRPLVTRFRGCRGVLDVGCGRGVFLDLLRDAGIDGEGIDIMPEAVAYCRAKGHRAEVADATSFLAGKTDRYDGILCSHIIEHLDFDAAGRLLAEGLQALRNGGRLVIVTPNSRDIAIMADVFWLDPTHRRPYPPDLIHSMLTSAGFVQVEVESPLGRPGRRRDWPAWLWRKALLGPYFGNPETIAVGRKADHRLPA
jgi:SAM-dependent methyltransferase